MARQSRHRGLRLALPIAASLVIILSIGLPQVVSASTTHGGGGGGGTNPTNPLCWITSGLLPYYYGPPNQGLSTSGNGGSPDPGYDTVFSYGSQCTSSSYSAVQLTPYGGDEWSLLGAAGEQCTAFGCTPYYGAGPGTVSAAYWFGVYAQFTFPSTAFSGTYNVVINATWTGSASSPVIEVNNPDVCSGQSGITAGSSALFQDAVILNPNGVTGAAQAHDNLTLASTGSGSCATSYSALTFGTGQTTSQSFPFSFSPGTQYTVVFALECTVGAYKTGTDTVTNHQQNLDYSWGNCLQAGGPITVSGTYAY